MKAHSTRLNATLCCKNMDIVELSNIIAKWAKEEALVTRAYVFGSRARNNFQVDSDLDVAVEIKKRPGMKMSWPRGYLNTKEWMSVWLSCFRISSN